MGERGRTWNTIAAALLYMYDCRMMQVCILVYTSYMSSHMRCFQKLANIKKKRGQDPIVGIRHVILHTDKVSK